MKDSTPNVELTLIMRISSSDFWFLYDYHPHTHKATWTRHAKKATVFPSKGDAETVQRMISYQDTVLVPIKDDAGEPYVSPYV